MRQDLDKQAERSCIGKYKTKTLQGVSFQEERKDKKTPGIKI